MSSPARSTLPLCCSTLSPWRRRLVGAACASSALVVLVLPLTAGPRTADSGDRMGASTLVAAPPATASEDGKATPAAAKPPQTAPADRAADQRRAQRDRGAGGRVRVRAPYTAVDVDPAGGRVRVRAPYTNVDIHW